MEVASVPLMLCVMVTLEKAVSSVMLAVKLRTCPVLTAEMLKVVLTIGATLSKTVTMVVVCLLFPVESMPVMVKLNVPPDVKVVVLLTWALVPVRA